MLARFTSQSCKLTCLAHCCETTPTLETANWINRTTRLRSNDSETTTDRKRMIELRRDTQLLRTEQVARMSFEILASLGTNLQHLSKRVSTQPQRIFFVDPKRPYWNRLIVAFRQGLSTVDCVANELSTSLYCVLGCTLSSLHRTMGRTFDQTARNES